MMKKARLSNGNLFFIAMEINAEKNFDASCFRGKDLAVAGNFKIWNSVAEMFDDELIVAGLTTYVDEAIARNNRGRQSCELAYIHRVGWSKTDALEKYFRNQLKMINLGPEGCGYILRPEFEYLPAPTTDKITIVFRLEKFNGVFRAIVLYLYPGNDFGEFKGNISLDKKVIFFEKNHPGESFTPKRFARREVLQ